MNEISNNKEKNENGTHVSAVQSNPADNAKFVASEEVDELIHWDNTVTKGKGDQQRHSGNFTQRIIFQCKAHTGPLTQEGRRRGSKKLKYIFI